MHHHFCLRRAGKSAVPTSKLLPLHLQMGFSHVLFQPFLSNKQIAAEITFEMCLQFFLSLNNDMMFSHVRHILAMRVHHVFSEFQCSYSIIRAFITLISLLLYHLIISCLHNRFSLNLLFQFKIFSCFTMNFNLVCFQPARPVRYEITFVTWVPRRLFLPQPLTLSLVDLNKILKLPKFVKGFSFFFRVYKLIELFLWDKSAWGQQRY